VHPRVEGSLARSTLQVVQDRPELAEAEDPRNDALEATPIDR
jgi:hypothetical protein